MLTASTFEMIVNDLSVDMDFRVESDGNANAIMVDAGLDAVGIMGVGVSGKALTVYGDLDAQANTVGNIFTNRAGEEKRFLFNDARLCAHIFA